jgi:lysozyme
VNSDYTLRGHYRRRVSRSHFEDHRGIQMIRGIDISDFQGSIDWSAVATDPQAKFVFMQATGGTSIVNNNFRTNHDGAKAHAIPFGAYHFFYGRDDGAVQAQHFLSIIDGYEGDLLPTVDVEEASLNGFGGSAHDFMRELILFDSAVRRSLKGKLPIIYFGYWFWQNYLSGSDMFAGHPAWPAAYNNDPDLDMTGTGWDHWTIWQFSDAGKIAGITENTTDLDRCIDLAEILR